MKSRVLVAAVGLPLLLVVVLALPAIGTAVLVAAMCVVGAFELLRATGTLRYRRVSLYTMAAAVLVCLWSYLDTPKLLAMAIGLAFVLALFCEMLAAHAKLKFRAVCVAVFAGLVLPYMLGSLIRLRCWNDGRFYILVAFVLTMVADSGAFFVGRALGKHKLAPVISPKKTVEGAIGGALANVAAMLLFGLVLQFAFHFKVNYGFAAIYGVVGAAGSMLGDLTFSVIKRQVGLKDFGNLLPGHGGILDRFDSTSVVAPLVELLLLVIPFAVR